MHPKATPKSKTARKHSPSNPKTAKSGAAAKPVPSWVVPAICASLVALVFFVFAPTLWHGFVEYDDQDYVFENPTVSAGLTFHGIWWAFTHVYSANWHPLTWISHMLDCQLFGVEHPGGHHFTNLLLHAAGSVLLFLVLKELTGFLWRSGLVAALFAVHPQRVESVAWVAERKDVLSGLFFMLTLGAYVRYVRSRPQSPGRFSLVMLFFVLGLLSKPMLVTLPFVLLLLDFWPLGRMNPPPGETNRFAALRSLFIEKIPLFALSAASCAVTVFAQSNTIMGVNKLPVSIRAANATCAYAAYLRQMVWPSGLAVFYPFPPDGFNPGALFAAVVLLASITAGVVFFRKRLPCLLVGWLWYLGMLVPVIGLLQVGMQTRADRYTYLPSIGISLMAACLLNELPARYRRRTTAVCVTVIAVFALVACRQTAHWNDTIALWTHACAVTEGNWTGQDNLGCELLKAGRGAEAIEAHRKAVDIRPNFDRGWHNLGFALLEAHRPQEAIAAFQKAIEIYPPYATAENSLGNAYLQLQRFSDAADHYRKAIDLDPKLPKPQFNLGHLLLLVGRPREAVPHLEAAIQLKPDYVRALDRLAWLRATCPDAFLRNGPQAMELAAKAVRLSGTANAAFLATLAAANAESSRFPDAAATARDAIGLASAKSDHSLVDSLREQLKTYQANTPFRDARLADAPR